MKSDSLLEYVIKSLKEHSGTWPQISKDTEIPYHTLTKIASKKIKDPGFSKVEKLGKYFKSRGKKQAA
jgi:predicted transcriptional regulator